MLIRALILAALTTVVAGCASNSSDHTPPPPAELSDTAHCNVPADLAEVSLSPVDPVAEPRAGSIPDGFVPVSALVCDPWSTGVVDAGPTAYFQETRWIGNFDGVENALQAARSKEPDTQECAITLKETLPDLWLTDESGRNIRVAYPTDNCGLDKSDILTEIHKLTISARTAVPVPLSQTGLRDYSGCDTTATVPAVGNSKLIPGSFTITAQSICRYSLESGIGTFIGATRFHKQQLTTEAITFLSPSPPCTETATQVAALSASKNPSPDESRPAETEKNFSVVFELDGCQRVLIDGNTPLASSTNLNSLLR